MFCVSADFKQDNDNFVVGYLYTVSICTQCVLL